MNQKTKDREEKIGRNYNINLKKRNELVKLSERYLGYDSLYIWNANINGIIIQLRTNDEHLDDFWRENWFPAEFNHNLSPHGVIYAVNGISDTEPNVYYHSETNTGIVLNTSTYGTIRSLALGMVMDISEKRKEIHFLRGSLVDVNGEGIVITGLPGSGKTTNTFMILDMENARIHSSDWIYVEHIGGEKGRISTLISERKFYINKEIAKINPRLKELFEKCKKEDSRLILDPWWIGGGEKFVDTTRIKVIFLLQPNPDDTNITRRLSVDEALSTLANSPEPFFNPHILIVDEERKAMQTKFFKEILKFAACYTLNTSRPLFDVQRRMKEIILSKEYLKGFKEPELEVKIEKEIRPEIDLNRVKRLVDELHKSPNVIHPKPEEIRGMAEQYGTKTKFGNYNFSSTVKNRSANLTVYVGSEKVLQPRLNPAQREILKNIPRTMEELEEYLKKAPFVCTETNMGDNPYFIPHCTMFVSTHRKEMVRLAHMINQTLFAHKDGKKGPKEYLVYIPEWQEKDRQILVFPEIGVTFVLGTDYYGEAKKGFLRMAMWYSKQEGMLGLHAGAKIIRAKEGKAGKIKKYSMIIFGLTATGKTTHTCHNHGLTERGEKVEIAQDDVIFLRDDCSALGTERGFYLKTEGINPEIQSLIYDAVTKPDAIFENVVVDYLGNVYFGDETLTGNGRGIMQRDDFGDFKADSVNLPPISEVDGLIIAVITRRNTVVPIASKLTLEQTAASFMLGESIESSGGDPKKAGESVREVGTNPFIIGDFSGEGNRFYEFIKKYPKKIHCYLLNTGGVGEILEKNEDGINVIKQKVLRVQIPEMAAIIRGIVRGTIDWKSEPYFGTMIPKTVEGVDMSKFELSKFYTGEQINFYVSKLKKERVEWLEKFKGLNPVIVNAVKD